MTSSNYRLLLLNNYGLNIRRMFSSSTSWKTTSGIGSATMTSVSSTSSNSKTNNHCNSITSSSSGTPTNDGGSNNSSSSTHTLRNKSLLRKLSSLPDLDLEIEDDILEKQTSLHYTTTDNSNHLNESPNHLSYVEGVTYPITSQLRIVKPNDDAPSGPSWPVFRIMDEDGTFRSNQNDGYKSTTTITATPTTATPFSLSQSTFLKNNTTNPNKKHTTITTNKSITLFKNQLSLLYPQHYNTIQSSNLFQSNNENIYKSYAETSASLNEARLLSQNTHNCVLMRAHRIMIRLRQMDDILLQAQRQGRISFYLTCRGEEGIHIGSASALTMEDTILAQYREQGVLMWRGFTLDQFTNQCFTNDLDLGRGRQMPIHYGSRALNYHTISSPLGTQLPQAVGVAYKMKLNNMYRNAQNIEQQKKTISQLEDRIKSSTNIDSISIVYFGDGAASTTDFHSAMNFASTLKVPMIFFCRNNGYAISTKVTDQYASDGIVCRSRAYGMAAIRVDGNDIFAVHAATKAAREYAIQHSEPVLIEAISYRQGHHSTSDDSSQYRAMEEVKKSEDLFDPLNRFEKFLIRHDWLNEYDSFNIADSERKAVVKAMERAEKRPLPKLDTMFKDVYKDMPLNLHIQEKTLQRHFRFREVE